MTHPLDIALEACHRGDFEASLEILKTMPDDARAQFNMGWHHLRLGDMRTGMEMLSVGRWLGCFGSPPPYTDKPIWHGEPLEGKKILLRGEGGFGDEIINVRFALDFHLRGANVTVSCSKTMMPLFRTLTYVDALIDNQFAHAADFDYWIPAMSAAQVLGCTYDDVDGLPYIQKPDIAPLPGQGKKIGLRWSGNPAFEDEQFRKFPKELMLNLMAAEYRGKASFFSLQRDDDLIACRPGLLGDMAPMMTDWLETARIVAALDLVITSCTSIAHLAGAMGVPVWVIVPVCPYYVHALPGPLSPWYDSMRIYRQEEFGNWDAPFMKVKADLDYVLAS